MIILWGISIISLIFLVVMLYCCLVVASWADDQMEKLMREWKE